MTARRKSLKKYEWSNLLFFLLFIAGLGVFLAFVFQSYRTSGGRDSRASGEKGVVSDTIVPETDACVFYLGTQVSAANRRYLGPHDIPVRDDGLVRELFAIPGVVEVVVDRSLVMLQKSPSAGWERIRPAARAVINKHLHMHP